MSDLWTMIWKEAKDSLLQGGREAWVRPLIAIGILGLFLPWQLRQSWLTLSPAAMLLILSLPFLFVSMSVGDAIAGNGSAIPWRRSWPAVSAIEPLCLARPW